MNVFIPNALWVGLSLAIMLLTGCTTPVSTVHFAPFPSASEKMEKVDIDDPVIRRATAIIDRVLHANGYDTDPNRDPESTHFDHNNEEGWYITTRYYRGSYIATMYNAGRKISASLYPAGKSPVSINLVFSNRKRFYLKMNAEILVVRDQIAEELAREFGREKVTTKDSYDEAFPLN